MQRLLRVGGGVKGRERQNGVGGGRLDEGWPREVDRAALNNPCPWVTWT